MKIGIWWICRSYGFAKTAKDKKAKFETMIYDYCKKREGLLCLFVLIDSRLPLQKIDLEFMLWCSENGTPFSIIYTKADKNSKNELKRNVNTIEKELLTKWEELPNTFVSSSEAEQGKEELLEFIDFHIAENRSNFAKID